MNLLSKEMEMTYDIYCYKSDLFAPDLNEAQNVTLMKDQKSNSNADSDKFKIIMALRKFNPKLDSYFMDGYNNLKINKTINDTHIALNMPKGEFATQITILNHCVLLSIPYWYSDNKANDVFKQTNEYIKIIRQAVCYYVYDPQAHKAYDPWNELHDALPQYENIYKMLQRNKSEKARRRFWRK
jgi:hypothetical protein